MDLLSIELLKLKETNFPVEQLEISRRKTERAITNLEEYFAEFKRTDFVGRFITHEYYRYEDGLIKLKEYHKQITEQINEKRKRK